MYLSTNYSAPVYPVFQNTTTTTANLTTTKTTTPRNPSLSAEGHWTETYWPPHTPLKRETLHLNAEKKEVIILFTKGSTTDNYLYPGVSPQHLLLLPLVSSIGVGPCEAKSANRRPDIMVTLLMNSCTASFC